MNLHMRSFAKFLGLSLAIVPFLAAAQVNSGSTGSDGALDLSATNGTIVIDMHDHPTGIYNYTYVNIPSGVTVTFVPNTVNTPVYWLVQSNVVINGRVDLSGKNPNNAQGGLGGPGGGAGGNGGSGNYPVSSSGLGAGGGSAGYFLNSSNAVCAGQASFGTIGSQAIGSSGPQSFQYQGQATPGSIYGNNFLIPLIGGSGGGGFGGCGGGGGGGAILIAANGSIVINSPGTISADGGSEIIGQNGSGGGGGSGGGIRLVTPLISGIGGIISTAAGIGFSGLQPFQGKYYPDSNYAGYGRIRFDTYQNNFSGSVSDSFTQGSQFIIFPASGQLPQLTVASVGGVPVSPSPTGVLFTPDAVLSAQQNNPIPIIVNCANLPLHTFITVSVKPANGSPVSATGYNDTGTLSSSTATISINIPRGGGLIYATATTGN